MLSLIQNEIVVQRGWLTSEQLTDIIAISQVTPGPIAINSATYVGYAVTGTVWGCGPRYAGCLHPVAYPDACGHEVLSQAARQPLRVRRHGGNETDDDRNDNGRGAPAPHPETFIDWKSWAILAAAFLASFKKDESYPHHRPLGSGRVIALFVTEPIQTILP